MQLIDVKGIQRGWMVLLLGIINIQWLLPEQFVYTGSNQVKTVVLDAGHGGKDNGCSGGHSHEKDITLKVVLLLGKSIERLHPDVRVIYTRDTDVFVPLYKRAALANRNNADLFISLHCNAFSGNGQLAKGSETYVMGVPAEGHNKEVADRENKSILLEEDYQANYGGFDPNSDEGHIFFSLYQNAFLDQSISLAEKIENNFKNMVRRRSRGVKQAGFVVLKETNMPSVLVEMGYLTNRSDEDYLRSAKGQTVIADALAAAFSSYKQEVEAIAELPVAIQSPAQSQEVVVSTTPPKAVSVTINETKATTNPSVIRSLSESGKQEVVKKEEMIAPEVVFKVQLAASPKALSTTGRKWSQLPYVEERKESNLYKYLTGSYSSYQDALKARNDILQKGFSGAFVVAYKNGHRVPLKEVQ